MKKNMKTRLFSGLMALCMLLSLLPTAAFAAEVPEYNTPEYPETSEGVTVESSFDSEAQKVLTTIVIGENVEGDTLDINLTDALGEALNNSLAVPGDVCDFIIEIENHSNQPYVYEDGSLVLGTDDYDGTQDAGYTGEYVTAFDGFNVYIGSKNNVWRSYNHALAALDIGIDPDWPSLSEFDRNLTDANIADALAKKGYENGIDDLDDYYIDYYNETHGASITDLKEADEAYIADLFSCYNPRGGQHPQVGIPESNLGVAALGHYYLYNSLISVSGNSLASYMAEGSSSYSALNAELAEAIKDSREEKATITLNAGIDGPNMCNCYQGRVIVFGMAFSLTKGGDKTSYPGLEKWIVLEDGTEVDADTAAAGDTVDFKLTSNVPEDLLNYILPEDAEDPEVTKPEINTLANVPLEDRGHYELTFHDDMDDVFIDPTDFVVMIGDDELIQPDQYTISYEPVQHEDGTTCDFEITVDLVNLYEMGAIDDEDIANATPITVTYTATLEEGTTAGDYYNTAWVSYPNSETEQDKVKVETFKIDVFKYDQADEKGLAGAEFALYDETAIDQDGNLIEGATPVLEGIVSGEDGHVVIDGLDAGKYALVETKAPDNYVKSDTPLMLAIEAGIEPNVVNVKFANSKIPHTGGMGTMLFTASGMALLAMAGAVMVIPHSSRKKEER